MTNGRRVVQTLTSSSRYALVEIGFTMVEGPDRAGQTLRPPMGVKEAEDDLFIRRPAGEDGWWAYEYIPVAKMLCEKYDIKATDFIEIPDVVEITGAGFAIPAMD
ncbi:hypothetical protein C8Q73DRAFT_666028 [Cubamyces lactineus]|nr:hypothetical protein C8Q73DRAFT_666028 [Cubamyces lactineus]